MRMHLCIVILLANLSCYGQTYSQNDFEEIPVPKDRSDEWYKLDTSKDKAFAVSIFKGKLLIHDTTYAPDMIYNLSGGKLLALDIGEWGGELLYKPNDSTKKYYFVNGKSDSISNKYLMIKRFILKSNSVNANFKGKQLLIKYGNAHSIFSYKGDLFFTQGLDHMGTDYGALFKLSMKDDSFTFTKILDFDDAPHAVTIYKDLIFLATFRQFYFIDNWKKSLVFDNLFWYGMNPNSIAVIDEEHIYVGMHNGYAKINLTKKELTFFRHKTYN
jgi:hypothetical protein